MSGLTTETSAHYRSRSELVRHAGTTSLGSGAVLAVNLAAGVLLSRALGAAGRGDYAAITAPVVLIGWLGELGCQQSVTYFAASGRRTVRELLGAWRVVCIPLALVSVLIGQAVILFTLADESSVVRSTATAYMACAALIVGLSPIFGVLLGKKRIGLYVLLRVAQAVVGLLGYLVLVAVDSMTLRSAVVVTAVGWVAMFAVGYRIVWKLWPPSGPPSMVVAREGLGYGLRAHGNTAANVLTLRLDLVLLPAFVGSAELGWYAVAASVAAVVSSLFGAVAVVIVPHVAADASTSGHLVGLAAVLAGSASIVCGGAVAIAAPELLAFVYGEAFTDATTALRWLLPGAVATGLTGVYVGGLLAHRRPGLASLAQVPGAVLTVLGLAILLPLGMGIVGTAILSSASYTLTLLIAYLAFRTVQAGVLEEQRPDAGASRGHG